MFHNEQSSSFVYIGSTTNLTVRISSYFSYYRSSLDGTKGSKTRFFRIVKENGGLQNLQFIILYASPNHRYDYSTSHLAMKDNQTAYILTSFTKHIPRTLELFCFISVQHGIN